MSSGAEREELPQPLIDYLTGGRLVVGSTIDSEGRPYTMVMNSLVAVDAHTLRFALDHRKVAPGNVFGAFRGAAFNGEDFIAEAVKRGAIAVVAATGAEVPDGTLAILDEPSEGLDPLMQQAFYRLLDDLRSEDKTVFFSSHVLSEVERLCDRVAIIRAGYIMAVHDVTQLLERRKRRVMLRWRGAGRGG